MKTPGVYIVEKNAFPNSVVQVATAVPAFIGYTEQALNGDKSLLNKPTRLSSLSEFNQYFGGPPKPMFDLVKREGDASGSNLGLMPENKDPLAPAVVSISVPDLDKPGEMIEQYWVLVQKNEAYTLYAAIRLFFQNGGGTCYVVSVGSYHDEISADALKVGLKQLVNESEQTMLVIPETTRLTRAASQSVQQAMLLHCGETMRNCFAILDMFSGYRDVDSGDPVAVFRNDIGVKNLDFGACYYPWVNTSIFGSRDFSFNNIEADSRGALITLLKDDLSATETKPERLASLFTEIELVGKDVLANARAENATLPAQARKTVPTDADVDKTLRALSPAYEKIMRAISKCVNMLPPAAGIAGLYAMVDNSRGVWKSPANVSMSAVTSPMVNISHELQETLNVDAQGKSINAIRTFTGEGVLVWGARTLDGNSLDWRYISVRRTMIMLEESIKLATMAFVFEPNTSNTWVTIRSMIESFLTGIWKQGCLAGAAPSDAFSVHVGLGETMTSVDVQEGILRVTVQVAITRPAEFIEITFVQQMQKS